MSPCGRSTILCPKFNPAPSLDKPASSFKPALAPTLINNLFQEFMRTCIKKIQDQASMTPNVKAKEDALDRLLKSRNPNLYYGNLYMEYYYFCQ